MILQEIESWIREQRLKNRTWIEIFDELSDYILRACKEVELEEL